MVAIANRKAWESLMGRSAAESNSSFVCSNLSFRPSKCWVIFERESSANLVTALPGAEHVLLVFSDEGYAKFFIFNAGFNLENFEVFEYEWAELVDALGMEYEYVIVDDTISPDPKVFRLVV
jgi:hypothetical protein